jgi:hypothetical protein
MPRGKPSAVLRRTVKSYNKHHKIGHNGGRTVGSKDRPEWELLFEKAIKLAEDAGEDVQARKIQLRYNGQQKDFKNMSREKESDIRPHRVGTTLNTQHKKMLQRLIAEVGMFIATDPGLKATKESSTELRDMCFAEDKQRLGLIREIITVIKALKEFCAEYNVNESLTKAEKESMEETKDIIKLAQKSLKSAGIKTRKIK